MFEIDDAQIAKEAGQDVLDPASGDGKLVRLADWLYGSQGDRWGRKKIGIRMAPSIITRSESELLGLSSPRFAFRAYIAENGFVTVRRRIVMDRQIRLVHSDECVQLLVKNKLDDNFNWIADCLLSRPPRLEDYDVLACDLARDYGEEFKVKLTPFVTHVDFGGGLCAQAACFMALCLSRSRQVLGIAEITFEALKNLASTDEPNGNNAFCIRGLSAQRVTSFFNSADNEGVAAQRQLLRLRDPHSFERGAKAVRTYIKNGMPVIQTVSLWRMLGAGTAAESPLKPLIVCSDQPADHQDYVKIPIGYLLEDPKTSRDPGAHCVVVVGCSNTGFLLNDPATFPFIECSDKQLMDICAYDQQATDAASFDTRHVIDETDQTHRVREVVSEPLKPPSYFQIISVTDEEVRVPLLNPALSEPGHSPHLSGLFEAIDDVLLDPKQFSIRLSREYGPPDLKAPSLFGEYYLITKYADGAMQSARPLHGEIRFSELVQQLSTLGQSAIRASKYWMHHVRVESVAAAGAPMDSFWFWEGVGVNVSATTCLRAVLVRRELSWSLWGPDGRELA